MNQVQQNYIKAQALYNVAFNSDSMDMTAFENALELVELRERELFVWARVKACHFCRAFRQSQGDSDAVEQLFDKLIAGEYVSAGQKEKVIALCLKLAA